MIEELECYKSTASNTIFKTKEEAEEYELDLVRAKIESYMNDAILSKRNCGLKRHHIIDMTLSLCKDYESTRAWIHYVNSIIG